MKNNPIAFFLCLSLCWSCAKKSGFHSSEYQQKFNYSEVVGSINDPAHFPEPDRWAMYQFGAKGINNHFLTTMQYPIEAFKAKKSGMVKVRFVVEVDGYIKKVEVISSNDKLFEKEAVRLVLTLKQWIPGLIKNHPVRTLYEMPVFFKP